MKKTFLLSSVIVACIYLMAGCGVASESGVSESRSKDGSDSDFVPDPVTVTDSGETDSGETVYSLRFDITDAIAFVGHEIGGAGDHYNAYFDYKVLADGRVSRICFIEGYAAIPQVISVYQYPSSITQDMIFNFSEPFVKHNNSGDYIGYGELLRIHSDNTFEDIIGVKGENSSILCIANDADGNLYYLAIDDSNTAKLAIYKYAVSTKQKTQIIGGLSRLCYTDYTDYYSDYYNFSVTKDGTYIMFRVYEENNGKLYIIPVANSSEMQCISNVYGFCYDRITDCIFFEDAESNNMNKIDLNNNFQRSIVNAYDPNVIRLGFDNGKVLITSYGIWGIISNGNSYSFIKVFNGDRTWDDVTTIGIPDEYSFNYDNVKNVDDVIYLSAFKPGVYRIYKMDSTGLSQPLLEVSGRNFSWDCNGRYILYSITTNATLTESSVTINKLKNLQTGEEIAIDENSVLNNIHLLK